MATQMLTINNTACNVSAVTPVSCNIGDEKETRMSLCLVFMTKADHLDQFKKGLRKALYAKVTKSQRAQQEEDQRNQNFDAFPDPDAEQSELTEPRFSGQLPQIAWNECYEGYTLALGSGLTAIEPRVFEDVKIKNFTIWAQSSGIIKIKCSALVACDRECKGWLCEVLRHDMQLWLSPPGEVLEFDFSDSEEEEEQTEIE